MVIGDFIDSEIMQLLPIAFAKSLVDNLLNIDMGGSSQTQTAPPPQPALLQPRCNNLMQQQQQPMQQQHNAATNDATTYAVSNTAAILSGTSVFTTSTAICTASSIQQGYGMGEPMNMNNEPHRNRGPVNIQSAQFQAFDDGRISIEKKNISLIMDVPLQVTVELGRTHKLIKDILEFGPGSIIELDKLAGEPVDILVNGKSIAKGEVVVIDESFGVRITDIIHPSKRL